MRNIKYYLLGMLTLLLVGAGINSISEDTFKFGDGTSSDKTIEANLGLGTANPKIQANATSGNWEFSNDGTTYAPFGSGSGGGGGINLAENSGFELSTNNWTNTGTGTFAVTTSASDVGFGDASGDWDAAAAADKLASDAISVPNGMANRQCHAEFIWKGGDANITAQVVDGTAAVLASQVLEANAVFRPIGQMVFPCPDSSTTLAIEFVASADAAVMYVDQVFFGIASTQTGAVVTKWTDFTLDLVNYVEAVSPSNTSRWRRVGDSIEVQFRTTHNGAGAGSAISFDFSSHFGLAISASDQKVSGGGARNEGTEFKGVNPALNGTGVIVFKNIGDGSVSNLNGTDFINGQSFEAFFTVPITGWEGGSTVNLTNDDVAFANAKFYNYGLSSAQSISNNAITDVTTWDNATLIAGGSFDGTEYTVASDGEYEFEASLRWSTSSLTTGNGSFVAILRNGTIVKESYYDFSASYFPTISTSYRGPFSKGDLVKVQVYQDSAGLVTLTATDKNASFSGKRMGDYTAGSTSGFLFADANNAGLISSESEGVWTPVLKEGANVLTASSTTGSYYKIGKRVFVELSFVNITRSGSGALSIEGLPFTNSGTLSSFGTILVNGWTAPANRTYLWAQVSGGQDTIEVRSGSTAAANSAVMLVGELAVSTSDIILSISYTTDD